MESRAVSDLRVVLLGKNSSEISRVGNFILDRDVFDTEAPPLSVEQHSERAGGTVEGRHITLINTPHLFHPQLSLTTLHNRVKECLNLCSPGPHVLLLVLQPDDFTETDRHRLNYILHCLSEDPHEHTLVVTTQLLQSDSCVDPAKENVSQKIITEYTNTHLEFSRGCSRSDLVEMVVKMVVENGGSHLKWKEFKDGPVAIKQRQHEQTAQKKPERKVSGKNTKEKWSQKMNLVVCGSEGSVKSSISDLILESSSDTEDLRVVLLGKTGAGKSATGNTILRKEVFRELNSSKSGTSVCQKESAEVRRRRFTVIDTPGLFDTSISNEKIITEIAKCITMAAPGPHVFLLVLTVGQRFTEEEKEAVKMIQELFGEESRRYTMVLFTKGDDLQGKSIEDYIKDSDHSLQNIIKQCGNRYHVFNNRNPEDQTQVTDLLEKIDSMVAVNGGNCYTNEMFQQVEKALREEQERILKEKKEEIEREKEELRAKHEAELEKLKTMKEEQRQNLEKEKRQKEEEFQKREAQIKEETNKERKKELDEKFKEQREAFTKEMDKKEQSLKQQLNKDLQYQKGKYKGKKENIWKRAKEYARRQAEKVFFAQLVAEGSVGGAALGAAVGSRTGLVGAAVGAIIGAAVGALIGAVLMNRNITRQ